MTRTQHAHPPLLQVRALQLWSTANRTHAHARTHTHTHMHTRTQHTLAPLLQVRALQLWSTANRNGQFRIYTNSRQENPTLQYSTVALTTGAAVVTILRWLVELRCVRAEAHSVWAHACVCVCVQIFGFVRTRVKSASLERVCEDVHASV